MKTRRLFALGAIALSSTMLFAACSKDSSDTTTATATEAVATDAVTSDAAATDAAAATPAAATETTATPAAAATDAMTSEAMSSDAMAPDAKMMGAFGAACSAVPADGAGSFAGMAQAPAATAASANPLLSTLVAAVTAAGLGDTLNGPGPFTIFAPTNDAFAKIDKATLDKLLADPKGDLTKILTFHVIPGKAIKAADLLKDGSEMTVQGSMVKITGSGQDLTVNGTAKVICGDVPVANGVVHIVDTVLLPS